MTKKYIPMTETTYYTLLAVIEPRHGYAIMQFVSNLTKERIKLGTGTLYTMVGRLTTDGLIFIVDSESGKKTYQITELGQELLKKEIEDDIAWITSRYNDKKYIYAEHVYYHTAESTDHYDMHYHRDFRALHMWESLHY